MKLVQAILVATVVSCLAGGSLIARSQSGRTGSAAPRIHRFDIDATKQWIDTNLDVRSGEILRVSASGQISYPPAGKNPAERSFNPDGLPRGWSDIVHSYAVPDANHGELIARIGSGDAAQPFALGLAKDFTAPVAGRLHLGINQTDTDAASAKGKFHVTIEILNPGPDTAAAKAVGGPPESKIAGFTPAFLKSIPRRVSDRDGNPGDLVNILIVGTEEQVVRAFTEAGWVHVDRSVKETVVAGLIDSLQKKDYLTMPMSELYLFHRPQDYGFAHAEPVRVAMSRNHLRIWKAPAEFEIGGRPLWCVAATHDIGFERDERNNTLTHQIDPAIDVEREYVNDTLSGTGLVAARQHVALPGSLDRNGRPVPITAKTATGGTFHSDGRILALILRNDENATPGN